MLKQTIKSTTRRLLRSRGWDLVRFSGDTSSAFRRNLLFLQEGIDLVLDVGANSGQFGRDIRTAGYTGRIISIEPLEDAYRELSQRAAADPLWQTLNLALSDHTGPAEINVSANSVSSSLQPIRDIHTRSAPSSAYVGTESITCETLDSLWPTIAGTARAPFLKIDVQGHEAAVLAGAQATLSSMRAIEIEMSLTELYEGQSLFLDSFEDLLGEGFEPFSLEPGFTDPLTGRVLQVDGIFLKSQATGSQALAA